MPARRIDYDEGMKSLRVNGAPFPITVLEALADMEIGETISITRDAQGQRIAQASAPQPKGKGKCKAKGKGEVNVKRLSDKVIWPRDKATAPFPEELKVNGKLPDEPLD